MTSGTPLPVLATVLLERPERAYLAWVAVAGEVANLPLESPPIDASAHALEIHVEEFAEPLVVIAYPMGAPVDGAYPLRLRPLDDEQANMLRQELFASGALQAPEEAEHAPRSVHGEAPAPISESHAASLKGLSAYPAPASRRAPGSLTGRSIGDKRFVLEKLLGEGASGEVYRASHVALRRAVAVKVLHPNLQASQDYCTRFYAEALAVSRLDHRNVLRVLDYGQEPDGLLYIVMELLDGKSLQDILDTEKRLDETRAVNLVAQACVGLAHAHDAGVIHRDIKPENLIVVRGRDDDGNETELVKVCDFGIAHWEQPDTSVTEVGDDERTLVRMPDATKIVGTPMYMSPEQFQNLDVDQRTDVYALGIVLYELVTGAVPFLYGDAMVILRAHMIEEPRPPRTIVPTLSERLEAVILKALEKAPEKRQRDTRELRAELRGAIAGELPSATGAHRRVPGRAVVVRETDFTKDPEATLAQLHDLDDKSLRGAYPALGEALKRAVLEGKPKVARALVKWVRERLAAANLAPLETELANGALRVLRDPETARTLASHLVDAKIERNDETLAMLREAGPVAATALIEIRRVRPPTLELRAQFVSTLRGVGPSALSIILAALEPLTALKTRQDEGLAEDLLRALPEGPSDAGGELTVKFVRLDKSAVGVAALRATTLLWGVRARPLLVGVLDAEDDGFRILALEQLRKLSSIDDVVVERLGKILNGQVPAGEDLKVAAASAFAAATARDARMHAIAVLTQRLLPGKSFMGSLRSALGSRGAESIRVCVALARSLRVLDPDGALFVLEKAASARPELRSHVDAILAGRS